MPEVTPTAAPGEAPWRYPDRIVPKTAEAAIKLKERMLSARAGSPTRTRRSTGPSPSPTAGPRTLRLRMRSHACSPSTSNGPARERNVLDKVATVECVEIELPVWWQRNKGGSTGVPPRGRRPRRQKASSHHLPLSLVYVGRSFLRAADVFFDAWDEREVGPEHPISQVPPRLLRQLARKRWLIAGHRVVWVERVDHGGENHSILKEMLPLCGVWVALRSNATKGVSQRDVSDFSTDLMKSM